MKTLNMTELADDYRAVVTAAERRIGEWSKDLPTNPVYAMEQADAVYGWTATVELHYHFIKIIEYGQSHDFTDDVITTEVREKMDEKMSLLARSAHNYSTSQSTNLMDNARLQSLITMMENFDWRLRTA